MPGKLTLFPSQGASRCFVLMEGRDHLAGRDPSCPVALDDPRVSARHALFQAHGAGWRLVDLESKNGTIVNGLRGRARTLSHEDWISFGGLLARFEQVSEEEAGRMGQDRALRLQTSTEIRRVLDVAPDARALLRRLVESAVAVVGAGRGFVLLLSPEGEIEGEVVGPSPGLDGSEFDGSIGALEEVLRTGRPLVAADARSDAFLGRRPSVAEMGIGALACVPLRGEGRVLGVLYVDGGKRGAPFTDLDLEILETLADHAALVLASIEVGRRILDLAVSPPETPVGHREFFREVGRRIGGLGGFPRPGGLDAPLRDRA